MFKNAKKYTRRIMLAGLITCITIFFGNEVLAKEIKPQLMTYQKVTEIEDWGAAVTKVIISLDRPIPVGSVAADTFKVFVKRSDSRLANPGLDAGYREVTKAYVSDKKGYPGLATGKYVVLEMKIGPSLKLGNEMNYDYTTSFNNWIDSEYTITQQKDIVTPAGKISNLVINTSSGEIRELVDDFSTGEVTYKNVKLTYADYKPKKGNKEYPLIIWLHGMGEGGTDPTVAIAGNKAANFASEEIQSFFGGAYVLAPQVPTRWMDGLKDFGDGTSIYQDALFSLIKDYISNNKGVDMDRVYIGGDSNGGYMTMLMIRDYPELFAAAFPTCEALLDTLITEEQIQRLKDLPIWFIAAANDQIAPVNIYTVPTYHRLIEAGAKDVVSTRYD